MAAMWIYLLISLIFLILALECYFKGGVNALVTLIGVFLAVNLAASFGPMAFQWMGDKWWPIDVHPFWNRSVPPCFAQGATLCTMASFGNPEGR